MNPITFPETHLFVPFRPSRIIRRRGVLESVLNIGIETFFPSNTVSPQALPAAANSQLEDHWEGIPHPVGGVAGLGRPQELQDVHAANHGLVDYNPLRLNVSNLQPSSIGTSFDQ
jgi:hypothetical protein